MANIAVAMSGGVDSSVAAALLKEKGFDIIGVTMLVRPESEADLSGSVAAARHVADKIGIRHYTVDLKAIFYDKVIAPFCEEYGMGRTPNPCVWCNRYIKFDALFGQARSLGAGYLATGHHARIESNEITGRILLKKGLDTKKDQSYFLYALTQEQLEHALFPVGSFTKEEVRAIAREKNLPISSRPESQDICFIPDNNYAEFLKDFIPQAFRPGLILDERGNRLGSHRGIMNYTIGQRRGLGIAASQPLYVTALEPERNAVIVGGKEKVLSDELVASEMNWIAIDPPTGAISARARIRYRHAEANVTITPVEKNLVYVKFKKSQPAITPGQAVVFYDGDIVLGGGTIVSSGKWKTPGPVKELVSNG